MTCGEENVLCICISVMILVLAAGITIGLRIPRELLESAEPVRNEQWFLTEAAEIYTMSLEWYGGSPDRKKMKRLSDRIDRYNREAGRIRRWRYRCPPRFSLEYLGLEE